VTVTARQSLSSGPRGPRTLRRKACFLKTPLGKGRLGNHGGLSQRERGRISNGPLPISPIRGRASNVSSARGLARRRARRRAGLLIERSIGAMSVRL
jgi:hypothetical protein